MSKLLQELASKRFSEPLRSLSDDTQRHYLRSIRQLGEYLERPPTIDDLNAETLMSWAKHTVEFDGVTATTANSRLKQIRALWDWAGRDRQRTGVETMPPKGLRLNESAPIPDSWTPTELEAIFAACARQTGWIGPHRAADWWSALHWWLYNTGERYGATTLVTPDMVNLAEGYADVPASIRKARKRPMRYGLSNRGVEAIGRLVGAPGQRFLFGDGLASKNAIYKRYRRLLADAGIVYKTRRSGPQKMRRTVATYIEHLGGKAGRYLGHAPKTVADESYLDSCLLMAHDGCEWPRDDFDPFRRSFALLDWFRRPPAAKRRRA